MQAKMFEKPPTTMVAIGVATKPYPQFRLPGKNIIMRRNLLAAAAAVRILTGKSVRSRMESALACIFQRHWRKAL